MIFNNIYQNQMQNIIKELPKYDSIPNDTLNIMDSDKSILKIPTGEKNWIALSKN